MQTIELKPNFCQKKTIVTFSKRFLEPTNTISPKNTRQFNIKILSTVINNVHVISVKQ